jgi:hypothetical protein
MACQQMAGNTKTDKQNLFNQRVALRSERLIYSKRWNLLH